MIDVLVKKGSLIFVKMSEDLEIDAKIIPQLSLNHEGYDLPFTFNFTRIEQL